MSSEIGGDGKDSSTNASMMGVPISVTTDSESSSVCSKFIVCHAMSRDYCTYLCSTKADLLSLCFNVTQVTKTKIRLSIRMMKW